jgi:predicted dehydrogenase
MITGWGAHHLDTAHWAMGTEYTGPVEVEAEASFPTAGLWDVHGDFMVHAKYANGVSMQVSGDFPNGVKFYGSEGWIFVSRGNVAVTSSDPTQPDSELRRPWMPAIRRSWNRRSVPMRSASTRPPNSTSTGSMPSAPAGNRWPRPKWDTAPVRPAW